MRYFNNDDSMRPVSSRLDCFNTENYWPLNALAALFRAQIMERAISAKGGHRPQKSVKQI
jgi:hypothetical protein